MKCDYQSANLRFLLLLQQVVELNGYVIIVVEGRDNKIKLYGSPADRDNLEVGDEILDVNERKLEDLPRAEVIRYIHEVIKIKRRNFHSHLNALCLVRRKLVVLNEKTNKQETSLDLKWIKSEIVFNIHFFFIEQGLFYFGKKFLVAMALIYLML